MDVFYIKLITSFFVGIVWITLLTILSERYGTKIGGAISGIPATMVITLFFIAWTQNSTVAAQATTLVPIILGINILFALTFVALSKYNVFFAFLGALILWFLLSFASFKLHIAHFALSLLIYVILLGISYLIFEKLMKIQSEGKKSVKYTFKQLAFRAVISGLVIAFSVFMAKLSGPIVGGIFATFPVLTVAMIIINTLNHGTTFTSSLLKNFILAGTINVAIFVSVSRYLFLHLSTLFGAIGIAFLVSLVSSYTLYHVLVKRMT